MPSARPATSAARRTAREPARGATPRRATRSRPRRVSQRLPVSRVRWDRASRIAMLVGLMIVAFVGIEGIVTLVRTHEQAESQLATVTQLARQNHRLAAEQHSLGQSSTIERDARSLGMVKKGERAFVVTGLSRH